VLQKLIVVFTSRMKMNYLANVGGDLDILETWDDP